MDIEDNVKLNSLTLQCDSWLTHNDYLFLDCAISILDKRDNVKLNSLTPRSGSRNTTKIDGGLLFDLNAHKKSGSERKNHPGGKHYVIA